MQGAIGDQYAVEAAALLLAVALADQDPAIALWGQFEHAGIEFIVRGELKVRGVVLKVATHRAVVRVGCYRLVHGKLGELGHAFGRDQMRAVVHGAVWVVDVPQSADTAVLFKANEGNAQFLQIARAGQPHGAGTDDGVHVS